MNQAVAVVLGVEWLGFPPPATPLGSGRGLTLTFVHPVDDGWSGTLRRVAGEDDAFALVGPLMDLLLLEEHRLSWNRCSTPSAIVIINTTIIATHARLTLHDDVHALRHGRAVDVGGVAAVVTLELLQRLVLLGHQRPRRKTRVDPPSVLHPVEPAADAGGELWLWGGEKGGCVRTWAGGWRWPCRADRRPLEKRP